MRSTAYQTLPESATQVIANLPPGLMYMPLGLRSEDNGGGWTPLHKLPENLPESASARGRALALAYWAGTPCTGAQLLEALAAGCGLAVLPERSGCVVLDCDVREDFIVQPDGSAKLEIVADGMLDLEKTCANLGEEMPLTYGVSTPSGGRHLYFKRPEGREIRSLPHRKDWCIDVKASPNTWCVAPPTAGYEPLGGEIAKLPGWLAWHLRDGMRKLKPEPARPLPAGMRANRKLVMQSLEEASAQKGMNWNNLLFQAGCRLGEEGVDDAEATEILLAIARPWNYGEQQRALRTIASGLRRGRRDANVQVPQLAATVKGQHVIVHHRHDPGKRPMGSCQESQHH